MYEWLEGTRCRDSGGSDDHVNVIGDERDEQGWKKRTLYRVSRFAVLPSNVVIFAFI